MTSRQDIANPLNKIKKELSSMPTTTTTIPTKITKPEKNLFVINHTLIYNYTNLVIQTLGLAALITIASGIIRIDDFLRSSNA